MDKADGVGSARLIDASNMYVPEVIRGNGLQKALKLYFAPSFGKLIDANEPTDALLNLYRYLTAYTLTGIEAFAICTIGI